MFASFLSLLAKGLAKQSRFALSANRDQLQGFFLGSASNRESRFLVYLRIRQPVDTRRISMFFVSLSFDLQPLSICSVTMR